MRVKTLAGHWLNTFSVEEVWEANGQVIVRTMAGKEVPLVFVPDVDLVEKISSEWILWLEN